MKNNLAAPYRAAALKFVALQGAVAIIAAVIVLVGWGMAPAQSALAGGFVVVLPNLVFALYAFRYVGARHAKHVYSSFKRGNGLKFLLMMMLLALVFKSMQIVALPFFAVFTLALFMSWFAPIFFH